MTACVYIFGNCSNAHRKKIIHSHHKYISHFTHAFDSTHNVTKQNKIVKIEFNVLSPTDILMCYT